MRHVGLALLTVAICMTPGASAEVVTFSKDVAPIIYSQCAACHREGEAAPFPLLSYSDVKKRAKQIVEVTASGYMPPWKADPVDAAFLGARHLSDAQRALLKQWVSEGCAEGDPARAPQPPAFTTGWQMGTPDLIVKMPEAYDVPATGRDIYRCFVIPVKIPAGKFVRALEYRPGNRRVVHHAVLTTLPKAEVAKRLAADGDATGPGFRTGLAAPGDRLPGPLGLWVPGMDTWPLPQGYAMAWPGADAELVLQLHLHPVGKPESEQSTVGLYFTDEKPKGSLRPVVLFNKNVDIPAGEKEYKLLGETKIKRDVEVIGLFPHMHLLGRTVHATATLPDGSTRKLLSIGDWDFNWQGYYQFERPMRLPAGTRVEAIWTFDNSAENPRNPSDPPRRVVFGEQTTNEMGVVILDVIGARPRR